MNSQECSEVKNVAGDSPRVGRRMKNSGPDSARSWVIAAACCFINMMMYGMARLAGVLFVASVPKFHVDRQQASFPYTFASFMRNASGPLVGYLGHKFGVRAVTTFGCLLGSFGIAMCYFAQNIPTVTVLWGTVFGLGFGLGNVLLPVSINQYFDKHRATASGISFSGACLGSFALPPIVEILLSKYELSGTYLFLAGFVLNCVPAALLLKKPDFEINKNEKCEENGSLDEKRSIVSGNKVKLYTVEDGPQYAPALAVKRMSEPAVSTKISFLLNNENGVRRPNGVTNPVLSYEERIKRLSTQTLLSNYSVRMSNSEPLDVDQIIQNSKGRRQVDQSALDGETDSYVSDLNSENNDVFVKEISDVAIDAHHVKQAGVGTYYQKSRTLSTESFVPFAKNGNVLCSDTNLYSGTYCNFAYQKDSIDDLKVRVQDGGYRGKSSSSFTPTMSSDEVKDEEASALGAFSIIKDPMFILIAITNALYCFTFVSMITVIVDYARDIQVGLTNEKYVLMSLSVGDLIGRLGLGWVTDRGYMTKTNFASFCFMCQGVAIAAVAWSKNFPVLVSVAAIYGLSEAGLILIFPLIVAQFIDKDKQTVAIPTSNFLSGPLCLAVSPLIGFFRDDIGSYDYIFYGLGIISGLCSFAWILAPCIAKCRRIRD